MELLAILNFLLANSKNILPISMNDLDSRVRSNRKLNSSLSNNHKNAIKKLNHS